jgi:hypothetical protein
MPTVTGTVFKANGAPVTSPQHMKWYRNKVLITEFDTEANGDYCVVLAAGLHCVVIAGYASNPATYDVTTVPLQTRDFNKTTNPPGCTTFMGTIQGPDGEALTGESQFMQWIGEGDAVVAELWTPPDGRYAIRVPYGSYLVKINGVAVERTGSDPCGGPGSDVQELNLPCPSERPDRAEASIAPVWPPPVEVQATGEICVCFRCSKARQHQVEASGTIKPSDDGQGADSDLHAACFPGKPHGKHDIRIDGKSTGDLYLHNGKKKKDFNCPSH